MATITVSGLGSGMDYSSWIDALVKVKQDKIDEVGVKVSEVNTKKTAMNQMKGLYTTLQSSIDSFTSILTKDNIFNQKAVVSSSEAVTASVDANANVQNLSIAVSQLATSTVAKSSSVAASYVSGSTLMSETSSGTITAGKFSVLVNGSRNSIDIATTDSMDSVLSKLNGIEGVSATLVNGKLSIASSDSGNYEIAVGSSSDTSNFSNVMSLTKDPETGVYTSSKPIFETKTNTALIGAKFAAGAVSEGTFTIGDEEFTVDSTTTMDGIIKKINSSENAGVTAYWDSNAGKIFLTAKDEGATSINIEAGTSNFTDIMGLTTSTWDGEGEKLTTKLNTGSQTLGTNAILSVSGTTITSSSNTVTSDISGIAGLTLTLNDKTTTDAKINVAQDTEKVVGAINSFVSAFNAIITKTATATDSKTGTLYGESLLLSLRNSVRSSVTGTVDTGNALYNSLAKIGITTGKFTTDASSVNNQLTVDTEKLTAALSADPEAVRTLLAGTSTTSGIFSKMTPTIENALDPQKGFFTSREKTYTKEVANLGKKVSRMELDLEKYQSTLNAKFQAMDELISALQNQASVFDSYFNKKDSDK